MKLCSSTKFFPLFSKFDDCDRRIIILILIFGVMAAFALAEYRFKGNFLTGLYLALGIMIPIHLGTVAILELMVKLVWLIRLGP